MQLSKNLTLSEVIRSESAKRRGINNMPTPEHLENLKILANKVFQPIRNHFKVPILISSGYRSRILNNAVNGAAKSQHCLGQAIDIDNDETSVTNKEIFDFIKHNLDFDQLIWEFGDSNEPSWVHFSLSMKGNKRQVIKAVKEANGKTTYKPYR